MSFAGSWFESCLSRIYIQPSSFSSNQFFICDVFSHFSGPTTVVIENSDRAVATVSNLQVGVYKFKLTVADEEDLQSTSTVKIKVIQSNSDKHYFNYLF